MLTVRELTSSDVQLLADYWTTSDISYMQSMGVDVTKIPSREDLTAMLSDQIGKEYSQKQSYALIWMIDGIPSGHSNINKIISCEEAYMHLHLWKSETRKKGMGIEFLRLTIPYYFKNYNLKKIICEPYAFNEAPNRILEKVGFEFERRYRTTPGSLNFEQEVNRWILTEERFAEKF